MGEMHGSLEKNSCMQKKNCELKEQLTLSKVTEKRQRNEQNISEL